MKSVRLSLPKNNFYGCIFFAAQYHRKFVTVLTVDRVRASVFLDASDNPPVLSRRVLRDSVRLCIRGYGEAPMGGVFPHGV